ncbi:putative pyridine nucleotide-disulfide oxidoreductase [Candidatus Kuenenia stuttgartiensis]|uniref:Putative pyridine nucleotide-disulfide oxidoreductase n=1 Tax=Kuenenia stuttgartiensis TaxID=174633 RepID=Q1Q0R7_KUEST|nr:MULTISPECIES: FAD-dependent oxidoreductase [Kuenenia]MBE7549402.1 FAD-dependent oxidoreductase [Planctomycetia bacterium]MBZ0190258.1 FAD-dependent oxidoreductase [Candidatus Kuenenia stuttgartiensis]MCF6152833.1 dehydrogenase [Candidatus Kuenenia stuttgartiensis]MCL4726737.1 FAD-dependent oxidoreductase [Candidatus Kuenenia stuttgartiensis]MCZ7622012.1 FAD-dependent oxidoreductase [Candidatus Kuenenia sp.]
MGPKRMVIIGAVASGTKTAAKARREDPDAEITLITEEADISYAACGTPYFISDIIKDSSSLIIRTPDYFLKMLNINVLTEHRVEAINPGGKDIAVRNLKTNSSAFLPYDFLVLATGAKPYVPECEGVESGNIFTLHNIKSAMRIKSVLQQKKIGHAIIVGGGFIALEIAESLMEYGIKAHIIIRREHILSHIDKNIALLVQNHVRAKGVHIHEDDEVIKYEADSEGNVSKVITKKQTLPAEIVVLATGIKPNVSLAKNAGIAIGQTGAIQVNERLETNIPDIYAVGDCVETTHMVTGKPVWIPLATTANKQGRIGGINICGGNDTFPGVMGTFIVKVFDWTVAKTGLSEKEAIRNGFDVVSVIVPSHDKPHYYPGSKLIIVKLIAEKGSGILLGAEIAGEGVVDKRIDVVSAALMGRVTAGQLSKYDLSYAPPYSSPMDPLITAANVLRNKLEGKIQSISPLITKQKLERKDDFVLLDVRTKHEHDKGHIEGSLHIPLNELKSRSGALDKTREIITYCGVGLRASQAHLLLKTEGFENVKFMEGSLLAWPYAIEK